MIRFAGRCLTLWLTLASSSWLHGQIQINEFLASNKSGVRDGFGQFSDWVEIFNTSDFPVALSDFHLTDDEDKPQKWSFPASVLQPGGHLLVFASGREASPPASSEIHANFKLSGDGEFLGISDKKGRFIDRRS